MESRLSLRCHLHHSCQGSVAGPGQLVPDPPPTKSEARTGGIRPLAGTSTTPLRAARLMSAFNIRDEVVCRFDL